MPADDTRLDTGHFEDARHAALSAAHHHPQLHHQLDGARHHAYQLVASQPLAGHHRQRRQSVQRVARRVAVDGRQRSVVAGVHRHQHVERLGATHLADDDAGGPHAQRIADQIADADLACTLDVLAAGLQCDAIRQAAIQLELGDLLHRHHALVESHNRSAERIQQGGLARPGLPAHQDVDAGLDRCFQELCGGRR